MSQRYEGKHFVVTGGSGAIGSRLVGRLLGDRAAKVAVIHVPSARFRWLLPRDPRVELINEDVTRIAETVGGAPGATIFHLAAFFANQNSVDHPLRDLHSNGQGTLATLLWAERAGARRVVYASAGCSIA